MSKKLTITIEGNEEGDLELALDEVRRLIQESFTSGFNNNDTGAFKFDIDEYAEQKELAW